MEEQLQTTPPSRRLRRKLASRSGTALTIGAVVAASVVTVGAATLHGHSIGAGGSTAITVVGSDFTGDASATHGRGWIDVDSWSWGASNSANIGSQSSGAGAGKVTFNPFSITRSIDTASPSFFGACASGHVFPSITFEADSATKDGATSPPENLQVILTNAVIKSCGTGGTATDRPVESLSFNYTKIEMRYTDSSGKLVNRYGWDLKANKKF